MRNSFFLFTRPLRWACTSPRKNAPIVHFFLRRFQLNINNLRYRRAAKTKKTHPSVLLSPLWRVMKISTATKQGSPSCEFPGSQPLSPSQCPMAAGRHPRTSTLPISNPIAAASDREVPLLVPPLMRTGLLALDPSTFLFGIAFTARCKAMLFCGTSPLCIGCPSRSERNGRK